MLTKNISQLKIFLRPLENYIVFCQHYEVEFIMRQRWEDPRLSHDDGSRHNFLNGIHHHGDIWKPDIYFIKHGTFKVSFSSRLKTNI